MPPKPLSPEPPDQPHQDRLGLVVGGVGQGDQVKSAFGPGFFQKGQPDLSGPGLVAPAGHVLGSGAAREKGQGTLTGQGPDLFHLVRGLGPEPVIETGHGQFQSQLRGQEVQGVQEGDRVGAPRSSR